MNSYQPIFEIITNWPLCVPPPFMHSGVKELKFGLGLRRKIFINVKTSIERKWIIFIWKMSISTCLWAGKKSDLLFQKSTYQKHWKNESFCYDHLLTISFQNNLYGNHNKTTLSLLTVIIWGFILLMHRKFHPAMCLSTRQLQQVLDYQDD